MDASKEELICKVVDGCANPEEEKELQEMAERDPEVAEALHAQQEAFAAMRSVGLPELQDQVSEQFWSGVYNRIEQRSGWAFVIVGLVLVVGYGVYELLTDPGVHTAYRLGIAALLVGLGLLISSVLRHRQRLRPHDRYTEVLR